MNEPNFEQVVNEDFFSYDLDRNHEIKFKFFKDAFTHHYNDCPEYNRYCKMHDVKPEDINSYEDLVKIQPIPSDAFRDSDSVVMSVPESEVAVVMTTSSTTSPKPVRFPIDKVSLKRMVDLNGELWIRGHELEKDNLGRLFFMAPKPTESDTGLVKGGYIIFKGLGFGEEGIIICFDGGKIDAEAIVEQMKNGKQPVHTYGPPFAYMPLIEYLRTKPAGYLKLSDKTRVIITGGWKGVKHDITKEQLMKDIADVLGIDENQVRDGYGSSDIMSMLPECKFHKKHVPLWNHVSVRDPEDTSKEVPNGQEGLVVLMASWMNSYPAFCMTGDMGYCNEGVCECGRVGQTVDITGRAKGSGSRGCAIRLEQFMEVITKKN